MSAAARICDSGGQEIKHMLGLSGSSVVKKCGRLSVHQPVQQI